MAKGQGHKVKGQSQICNFVKNLFWLYIMNQWLDINDAYTYDKYWLNVDVDLRSRSQGQRSRSNLYRGARGIERGGRWRGRKREGEMKEGKEKEDERGSD